MSFLSTRIKALVIAIGLATAPSLVPATTLAATPPVPSTEAPGVSTDDCITYDLVYEYVMSVEPTAILVEADPAHLLFTSKNHSTDVLATFNPEVGCLLDIEEVARGVTS